jgi:SAM-dependent methyltransferase
MRRSWLDVLACPACGGALELDATRQAGAEVVEAFLLCQACLQVRFVAGGSAILPHDLERHLRAQGGVYRRTPLADPRVVRFVLARLGAGEDHVPFDEVTRRYGDLVADAGAQRPAAPEDVALERLASTAAGLRPIARALDLGTGVGRGAFVLAAHATQVVGVDRSAARIRRARNLAVTEGGFRLPVPGPERREVDLQLDRLARRGVDFAVGEGEHLPFAAGAFDLVVRRAGDGAGPWDEPARVAGEVRRVLAPAALLVRPADEPPGGEPLAAHGGWCLDRVA